MVFLASPSLGRGTKDKDCNEFSTQKQTQQFFKRHLLGDPHILDRDNDGRACESLL